MSVPTCSLSILAARTDIPFMMHTIPHIVRACKFPFVQRSLIVDTAPLTGDKVNRPGVGTMEQLRECCSQLVADGVIDRVVDIDYDPAYRRRMYLKHFGNPLIRPTHNYKGYPILGTIFSLEEVPGDYVLHFDSDMLLYQAPNFSWIDEAIRISQRHSDILAIRPLAGPPHPQGPQQESAPEYDPSGFYRFKTFGSRVYLFDRRRFEQFLPLSVRWRSFRNPLINALPESFKTALDYVRGKGKLISWEIMFTEALQVSPYFRANLASPNAWTLHPIARGPEYIQRLPEIIQRVEAGWYPEEQAGYYDLNFEAWKQALAPEHTIELANG